jgi:GNAT superfamily N-acetyltransferase
MSDVLYLAPEYRKGTTGIRLMKTAEEELVKLGVQRIVQNVKLTNDWGSILERMGYKPFERIYTKVLRK